MIAAMAVAVLGFQSAQAATFNLVTEGGGTAQVFQLNNGNKLGLFGFDTRNPAATGGAVTLLELTNSFAGGASVIEGFYFGSNDPFNAANGGASEFDEILGDLAVANDTRFFDSLWVEWNGLANLVHNKASGGTSTLSNVVSLSGDPLAPIPLPAAAWMLLAGLGGLGLIARRRKAAA